MNIFYNWEYRDHCWTKNFIIKDHQIYDFVQIYCYEKECQVYFHKDYENFMEIFNNYCPAQTLNVNSDEEIVNFVKNKIDQFLDKIPKLLSFI